VCWVISGQPAQNFRVFSASLRFQAVRNSFRCLRRKLILMALLWVVLTVRPFATAQLHPNETGLCWFFQLQITCGPAKESPRLKFPVIKRKEDITGHLSAMVQWINPDAGYFFGLNPWRSACRRCNPEAIVKRLN